MKEAVAQAYHVHGSNQAVPLLGACRLLLVRRDGDIHVWQAGLLHKGESRGIQKKKPRMNADKHGFTQRFE
jgi:hypothetical protein|tara:strand:+ start:77 stop:289 length:213 start_codon:yes stop_codon:yes gene_type:complete